MENVPLWVAHQLLCEGSGYELLTYVLGTYRLTDCVTRVQSEVGCAMGWCQRSRG